MKKGVLFTLLALNLTALGLYLWAARDITTVTIEARGGYLDATVGDIQLSLEDSRFSAGGLGVYVKDFRTLRAYTPPTELRSGIRGLMGRLGDWIAGGNLSSRWDSLTVVGPDGRQEGFDNIRRLSGGQLVPLDEGPWDDFTIVARLSRGLEEAAIMVRSTPKGDGYLFWFRPEHGDVGWRVVEGGQEVASTVGGPYRPSTVSAVKAILRGVIWSYFWALGLLGLLLALSLLLAFAVRRNVARPLLLPGKLWPWTATGIGIGGTALAAIVSSLLLERLPHVQDSVAYLFQAKTYASGHLWANAPSLPDFFEQEFILVRDGMWFSKYPPGFPLLLSVGVLLKVPWLVNPVLGGLSLGLVYMIGKELYGQRTGVLAAFLGLASPFFIFMSASFMAHPASMFLISLFTYAFVKTVRSGGMGWAILAGAAMGLAFITRGLSAVALGAPFALVALGLLARDLRGYLPRFYLMAVALVPFVLFLLWYQWRLTGDPFMPPHQLWWGFDKVGFGDGIGIGGSHTPAAGLMNAERNIGTLMFHLYGWPNYLTLAFLFLPFAALRAGRWDALFGVAFLSLVTAYVFYWSEGIMYGPRYYYEALPFMLLLTARGLALVPSLAGELAGRLGWRPGLVQVVPVGLLLMALLSYNIAQYMPGQWGIYRDYNYVSGDSLKAVKRAGLKNALVFVVDEPEWQWWKYGEPFSANSPSLDSSMVFARDMGSANRLLMEEFPGRDFYLLDGQRLEPLE